MKNKEQMPSSEEIAEIEKQRTISDAELLKEGAEYKIDKNGKKRLSVTEKQIEDIAYQKSLDDLLNNLGLSDEEKAGISISDLLKNGAEYATDEKGNKSLRLTEKQIEKIVATKKINMLMEKLGLPELEKVVFTVVPGIESKSAKSAMKELEKKYYKYAGFIEPSSFISQIFEMLDWKEKLDNEYTIVKVTEQLLFKDGKGRGEHLYGEILAKAREYHLGRVPTRLIPTLILNEEEIEEKYRHNYHDKTFRTGDAWKPNHERKNPYYPSGAAIATNGLVERGHTKSLLEFHFSPDGANHFYLDTWGGDENDSTMAPAFYFVVDNDYLKNKE